MSNVNVIPYTEMFEVIKAEWVRDGATDAATEAIYKSHINFGYTNFMPQVVDEEHLRKSAFITTKADYSVGTVDISAAGTTVDEGDTDTAWTEALTDGALFKENSSNLVVRVDYTSGAQLTFQNSLAWAEDAVDEGSYKLVFDRYALPSDFGHMMRDRVDEGKVVSYFNNGGPVFLDPLTTAQYDRDFFFTHSTPSHYTVKKDFATGTYYLYINPPDTKARIMYYSYVPELTNLLEYTTGTVTFGASTAVAGSDTVWTALDADLYDYYIRNDADGTGSNSLWFKISSITDATNLVLATTFSGTAGAGATYTIASVSKYPPALDRAIMLLAAAIVDPDTVAKQNWFQLYTTHVQGYSSMTGKQIIGLMAKVIPPAGRKK